MSIREPDSLVTITHAQRVKDLWLEVVRETTLAVSVWNMGPSS